MKYDAMIAKSKLLSLNRKQGPFYKPFKPIGLCGVCHASRSQESAKTSNTPETLSSFWTCAESIPTFFARQVAEFRMFTRRKSC
jgi:hypothetical protein